MSAKHISILFSGGVDSTSVAIHYLKSGYIVHLLTFNNGAEQFFDLPRSKADSIIKKFPDRCSWQLLDCTYLFHELAIKKLEEDVKKYGNLVCCGCKLAMLSETILYCKRKDIKEIADGFQKEQSYYPEQTPQYMVPADAFAKQFGISYRHPLYEAADWDQRDIALSASVPASGMQAYCLFGHNPVKPSKRIEEYVKSKIPGARKYVKKNLKSGKTRDEKIKR